ncbi:MAG: thioredoxin family protein [Tissierellia bacterium]|nr:thioredoxin family protein [Tissierellia bacterium]
MRLFKRKKDINTSVKEIKKAEKTKNLADRKVIEILGSGCAKCIKLEQATRDAVSDLQLDYKIEHVRDFAEIASYGVMSTPALLVDGKVLSYGKLLSVDEIKEILSK